MTGTKRKQVDIAGNPALFSILFVVVVILFSGQVFADDIRVITNVETRDVYTGESFLMQITVDGSDEAIPPDFSSVKGFTIEYVGGSNNSSQSISIINGRVKRTVKKGFVFTYRLTPRESGRLVIPSLDIHVAGIVFKTKPITITVKKPEETEDFKLRIRLSRETCYVGEPVILTVAWYLNRDIESFSFTAPILDNPAFDFDTPEVKIDPSRKYFRIPIGGGEVIAEKGKGILDGEQYVMLAFSIALFPKQAGTFIIPEFIVACESGTGIRNRMDFFNDFFSDSYSGRWRGSLKKYVVPSNRLSLKVKDLPVEGCPAGFAGHVGGFHIETAAEPVEVNVGDPITLKIILEGPDYPGRIDLPPLSEQKGMTGNFKIPDDRADGKIEGKKKVFTQTLRVKHDGVTEIPSIRIVYFDTEKERYMTAESDPIPLVVRTTRIVTASDAEGIERSVTGSPLEKWKEGIAYNYEGPEVIVSRKAGIQSIPTDTRLLLFLILPPAIFVLVAIIRRSVIGRSSDLEARKAKGALKRLNGMLDLIRPGEDLSSGQFNGKVMDALKEYLGDKLHRSGAALTAGEVDKLLRERGVEAEVRNSVKKVLEICEQGAYAGSMADGMTREEIVRQVRESARKLGRII